MLIYDSLIASKLAYCNILWGSTYASSLSPLFNVQKRSLKICLQLPKLTSTDLLFEKANRLVSVRLVIDSVRNE